MLRPPALVLVCFVQCLSGAEPKPFVLGPDDEIVLHSAEIDEFREYRTRIGKDGTVSLPMIGRLTAGGMMPARLEELIAERLRLYYKRPDVSLSVGEYASQPISVLGAVQRPGIFQLSGEKRLLEVLAMAGGVSSDVGHSLTITRSGSPLDLAGTVVDEQGRYSAEVRLSALLGAGPEQQLNILMRSHDTVVVSKSEVVYVLGEVGRPGGYPLGRQEHISLLEAVALANGIGRTAALSAVRVLRMGTAGGERTESVHNIKRILAGKDRDLQLSAGDILYIPAHTGKKVLARTIEAAVQTGSGILIWRGPQL
jgi:polysaccharide export outer membrane protein